MLHDLLFDHKTCRCVGALGVSALLCLSVRETAAQPEAPAFQPAPADGDESPTGERAQQETPAEPEADEASSSPGSWAAQGSPSSTEPPLESDSGAGLAQPATLPAPDSAPDPAKPPVASAPAATPAQGVSTRVGYEKGFFIETGDEVYSLHLQGTVQPRFTFESLDAGSTQEREEQANFSIARARIKLHGSAHSPRLTYTFQADFGKGSVALKDYFVDYALVPEAVLRVGQFKRPFSRQQVTSSASQQFVDRSITDKGFGAGRDLGLMLHDAYEKSPSFEYALGIFNGDGDTSRFSGTVAVDPETLEGTVEGGKFSNVPSVFEPMMVARLGYNSGEMTGYKEVDFEGGPLRLAIAASGLVELDADADDVTVWRAEGDYMLKAHGFSTTGGLYVSSRQDGPKLGDRALDAFGGHVQAGYLVGIFEPALRYASVQPMGPNNNLQEVTLCLSLYFFKHELKWQTDSSLLLTEDVEDKAHYQLRSQFQLAF